MTSSGSGQFKNAGLVWGPKNYILAASTVTLTVSVVVIVTTVVLIPARIAFSITGASSSRVEEGVMVLNFTLHAVNPSRRAWVKYSSVTAGLLLYNVMDETAPYRETEVYHAMPLFQPPASSRNLRASVLFGTGRSVPPMSILVVAQVWFKVGLAYSRQCDVHVSCQPVDFFAAVATAAMSVDCVA